MSPATQAVLFCLYLGITGAYLLKVGDTWHERITGAVVMFAGLGISWAVVGT